MSDPHKILSSREREVLDVIYGCGHASARTVREKMKDPPSDATVRTILRTLETKGFLTHAKEGRKFIYTPVRGRGAVGLRLLRHVVRTFYGDSDVAAVSSLLGSRSNRALSDADRARIEVLLEELEAAERAQDRGS